MRFNGLDEMKKFVCELVDEVVKRLNEAGLKGQQLTVKLRLRSQDAPMETKKFLGHGVSDAFSKSMKLPIYSNTSSQLLPHCNRMLFGPSGNGSGEFGSFDPADVRGMRVQLTKLVETSAQNNEQNTLMKAFAKTGTKRPREMVVTLHF